MTISIDCESVAVALPGMSEIQRAEGDRKQRIGHDHQENRLDDTAGGLAADAVGAALGTETLKAADHGDDGGENRRLAMPTRKCGDADGFW